MMHAPRNVSRPSLSLSDREAAFLCTQLLSLISLEQLDGGARTLFSFSFCRQLLIREGVTRAKFDYGTSGEGALQSARFEMEHIIRSAFVKCLSCPEV